MKSSFLKSTVRLWVISIAAACSLSMYEGDHYDLLDDQDYEFQFRDMEDGPALSSTLDEDVKWESFNEWQCFPALEAHLECTEVDNGAAFVPTIRVAKDSSLFDFSLDPVPNLRCSDTLSDWVDLLARQKSFCVYAAYLQDLPAESFEDASDWTLWIVTKIKTSNGMWMR